MQSTFARTRTQPKGCNRARDDWVSCIQKLYMNYLIILELIQFALIIQKQNNHSHSFSV